MQRSSRYLQKVSRSLMSTDSIANMRNMVSQTIAENEKRLRDSPLLLATTVRRGRKKEAIVNPSQASHFFLQGGKGAQSTRTLSSARKQASNQ